MDRVKNDLKRTDRTVVIDDVDDRDRWKILVEAAFACKAKKKNVINY